MIDIKVQKVDAIKALREFCATTFGTTNSLKADKQYVEQLQTGQFRDVQMRVYQINTLYLLLDERLKDQRNTLPHNDRMILQEIRDILNTQVLNQ